MGTKMDLPETVVKQLEDYAKMEKIPYEVAYIRVLSESLASLPQPVPEEGVWQEIDARPRSSNSQLDLQQLNTGPTENPDRGIICTFLTRYFGFDQPVKFGGERREVDIQLVADGLKRLSTMAETDENWFTFQYPSGTWGGIGIENFVTCLETLDERFDEGDLEDAEYGRVVFVNRLYQEDYMLLYLTLSGEYGNIPRCRLEFLTSGYPVDPHRYQELAAQFGCRLRENARAVTIDEFEIRPDEPLSLEVRDHHHTRWSSRDKPEVIGLTVRNPFVQSERLYQRLLAEAGPDIPGSKSNRGQSRQLDAYDDVYTRLLRTDFAPEKHEYHLKTINVQRLSGFEQHSFWNVVVRADYHEEGDARRAS